MSYYHDHNHTSPQQFQSGKTPQRYGALVGTVESNSERPITGRSGDHLQFYVSVNDSLAYQVDVNTQSRDGSDIEVYIATQSLQADDANPAEPFGPPAYGVFPTAQLSYAAMGLNDTEFEAIAYNRIDGQLKAALDAAHFVAIYGMMFDDGGDNGKGIHETHFTGRANQDGAIAIYGVDGQTGEPVRTWFFFKFETDSIAS